MVEQTDFEIKEFVTLNVSWPWPWIRSHVHHSPTSTSRISFESEKTFCG